MTGDTYATQVMIAEKAADLIREKDSVKAIKEYFKHLIESRNARIMDDDELEGVHGDDKPVTPPGKERREHAATATTEKAPKKH